MTALSQPPVTPRRAAAPETLSERAAGWASRVVMLDAILFALFMFDRTLLAVVPGVGPLPGGVALTAVIAAVASNRKPKYHFPNFGALIGLYVAVLAFVITVSVYAGADWQSRALRWLLLLLIVWVLVQGRFDAYSAILGVAVGLGLNAVAYYAGLTSDNYPPFLTGFLEDKNVSGLWYGLFSVLGIALWRENWQKVVWAMVAFVPLFLTGSRTSMSAFAVGILWILIRNRFPMVIRLVVVGIIMWALNIVEERFARIGIFANRDGTDWFREQIHAATWQKVAGTPWTGRGLGEAWVIVYSDMRMLFHDSYAALYVEGGTILVIATLVLFVFVAGAAFSQRQLSPQLRAAEAAIVAMMVCAWQLGEVFFTSAAFIVLGVTLRLRYSRPVEPEAGSGPRRLTNPELAAQAE